MYNVNIIMGTKKEFISQEYSTEKRGKNLKEGTRGSRAVVITATSIFGLAIIVGVSLVSFTIIFFFSDVRGTSMMRHLNANGIDEDSVVVNRFKSPQRGDVIVVNHYNAQGNWSGLHIKRLIAVGGDNIHFRFVPANSTSIPRAHYVIEINGVVHDNVDWDIFSFNARNPKYDKFYAWQQSGGQTICPTWLPTDSVRRYWNNNDPGFRHSDEFGNSFVQWNEQRSRYEVVLPHNYIFYMGDHRGGDGSQHDLDRMSADSTHYGPQPRSVIVGTVVERVHNKSAGQWFGDKMLMIFTFGIVRR